MGSGKRGVMASMTIRFPDGDREFRHTHRLLAVGDVLMHDGEPFRVITVSFADADHAVVVVVPDSAELGEVLRSEQGALELVGP
jgi:hypothetical protein